jgi:pimeloyl-ACP methyl ester carboxylesterase
MIDRFSRNHKESYLATIRSLRNWDVTGRLTEVDIPTLLLVSELDAMPVTEKQAYVGLFPNARLIVVPGAHHALPMEAPEVFNAHLREFIMKH